jgi:hypothetical protein
MEELLKYLADTYPRTTKLYPIGHSWEERTIWCLEISSNGKRDGKTPLALCNNIHGDECESAEGAAYTAWWLASGFAANDAAVKDALDGYVWYIIPIMNVDGYVRSTYSATRQNMRPRGNGLDEPTDRDGDGKTGGMFVGSSATTPPYGGGTPSTSRYAVDYPLDQITDSANNYLGLEGYDGNGDGRFGNSTKQSAIDMNRSFDHFWTLYRPTNTYSTAAGYPLLGASDTWNASATSRSAGPGPASEPEVQAIQNFFIFNPVRAMIAGHTGSQNVFYPWCYTSDRIPEPDYTLMSTTAQRMCTAFTTKVRTVRPSNVGNYTPNQSYRDYPTSSEMIDWLYARMGTHAYTVEVYASGSGSSSWGTSGAYTFPARWVYYGPVTDGRAEPNRRTYEHVWIYTTAAQAGGRTEAPADQYILCDGFKDCSLQMAFAEARYSPHPGTPAWMIKY